MKKSTVASLDLENEAIVDAEKLSKTRITIWALSLIQAFLMMTTLTLTQRMTAGMIFPTQSPQSCLPSPIQQKKMSRKKQKI